MWKKKLQNKWLDLIKCGKKTLEGRLHIDDWTKIQIGDKIIFVDNDDVENEANFVFTIVTDIAVCDDYEHAVEAYYNGLIPGHTLVDAK